MKFASNIEVFVKAPHEVKCKFTQLRAGAYFRFIGRPLEVFQRVMWKDSEGDMMAVNIEDGRVRVVHSQQTVMPMSAVSIDTVPATHFEGGL